MDARYHSMFDDLCAAAWSNVGCKEDDTIIGVACDDELHTTYISALAFADESGFDIDIWNEQIDAAFSGLSLWFIGLAMPFVMTDVFGREHPLVAVAGMDRIQITIAAIKLKKTRRDIVPVCWEPATMFHPLDILVPALRRHVTHQG